MSPQYQVIKQCMQLLKESNISAVKKLRLEIQFMQLLRVMLNQDLTEDVRGVCSKDAFDQLHLEVRALRHDGRSENVNELMEHIGNILVALSEREREFDSCN
ncbi:hypothetical protein [Geomonas anaerohicana]|uniref:Uncharacterized protein n=1 Tax=Geomonas anaerohicana TaxID=2798583 RepID=A0ABS0YGF0_9BACT|nr:hypothetical protein [Geomonas anaerohicana]MBJ6751380.1 hypothetical protein [Geomonas anaerohicana]